MSILRSIIFLFRKKNTLNKRIRDKKNKENGVKIVSIPTNPDDPRELKGTKLADCTFQAGPCPALS